jgi:competence protein ComEA
MDRQLPKEQQLIVLGLIASIVIGLAVMALRPLFYNSTSQLIVVQAKGRQPASPIEVHVCGAVRREGVYKLKEGDRVLDAVTLAGGAQLSADLSALNLAETVKDGEKIMVPAKQLPVREVTASETAPVSVRQKGGKASSSTAKININIADEKALDSLPGVGPATAKAIVEYRRTKGPFARPEQIMEIPRFGKSKFEKIKNMIII